MTRKNITEKNLQKVSKNLDKAYEHLERAIEDLSKMSNLPDEIVSDIERFDITEISSLKGEVDELIEKIKV